MNGNEKAGGESGRRKANCVKIGRIAALFLPLLLCGRAGAQDGKATPQKSADGKPAPPKSPNDTQAPAKSSDGQAEGERPAVNPSIPTITDSAALTPPGWLEADFAPFKNLDRDRLLGTPLLLKLTSKNLRVEYRLATDGYLRLGDGSDGFGDTYAAAQYLFKTQNRAGFDVAGRFTLKIPTQPTALSGTGKFDYNALFLFSRDFTKWQFHGDFNVGLSSLSRQGTPGTDQQFEITGATNTPIRGGRWVYQNELVYFSGVSGSSPRLTTMHAFSHAAHQYEVYSAGLQWQMQGDGPVFQIIFGAAFFPAKLF